MAQIISEAKVNNGGKSMSVGLKFMGDDCKNFLRRFAEANPRQANKTMSKKALTKVYCNALACIPPTAAKAIAVWMVDRSIERGFVRPVPKIWVDDIQEYKISENIM